MNGTLELDELEAELFSQVLGRVQHGPFFGMVLTKTSSWYGGQIIPKLLGLYEAELGSDVERAIKSKPQNIINIGCAEGYYAVGFACRLPESKVFAFDIDPKGLEICETAAMLNNVVDRFEFHSEATDDALTKILLGGDRSLLFMDCEGAEREILEEISSDSLKRATVMVECHDFITPGVTEFLQERLGVNHRIHLVNQEATPVFNDISLKMLSSIQKDLRDKLAREDRPVLMHWICAYPKDS